MEVNLTTGAIVHSTLEHEALRRFVEGGGLAAKLFLDQVSPDDATGERAVVPH